MDFSRVTVLCLGDLMLDRFIYGAMERISPEAPVPVLRLTRTREMAGGVGNVANNIRSLGGRAILLGLTGDDAPGHALRQLLAETARIENRATVSATRPTTCKTRFIAANQQVIRADEESLTPLTTPELAALREAALQALPEAQAVIVSDYGKGVCHPDILSVVIDAARQRGTPVFVDPKSLDFTRYHGATCITPNARELGQAAGFPTETLDAVEQAARFLMAQAGADAILATRSERGMALVEGAAPIRAVPSRAREVFDVSGAGDTVIATMALAHAAGSSLEQAMHIANAAAGVVVGKLGTATADIQEVTAELEAQLDTTADGVAPVDCPLLDREGASALAERWRAQGLRIGFANGCFDLLHPGHIALLTQARAACDRLIVALNTDASVQRLKGPSRPVNPLADRAAVIGALRHVDAVTAFDEDTPLALIQRLLPDVLVKGADYTRDQVVGADVVEAHGGRVLLATLTPGRSTTAMLTRAGR
ncbi:ADP-heptose synthase [Neoasaia chiangmaiensis NBRC 101099]|uniref:Bifunctional protein HldE n=1 Tax=Neoasaia chiangmaiensis TaxID=320497 RepID=A0A1U9KRC3_9PROT|nr:D-glycero-beta-D-manno-heptose-7-phosphate kinase [Neoasaia chiangmaiensis]AQS88297.1 bifunctional heptose 7-phosphate kinase/heptose 1-phosphate adenyltransferase [Neoasaia chiangmaiensis]GBR39617.1 ADP-heptose synthase [Neoasaia chiangmaiensis NBRC 101099]GEN14667.1 bifunctional protein HldE [Neoasaia chiangmaiensis]